MLVITRRKNESFTIGKNIKITMLQIRGGKTLVGIEAPLDLFIKRHNLKNIIKERKTQDESARDSTLSKAQKWGIL